MHIEYNVPIPNTFRIAAVAHRLVRITQDSDITEVIVNYNALATAPKLFILGGGSNIILTRDLKDTIVLKVEILGKRLVEETEEAFIVEAGAGESWHCFVQWTLQNNYPGLENLALIPGTVGASPVQNIGAYGVELKDRCLSVEVVGLSTGKASTLTASQCDFSYRDSIFKRPENNNKVVITKVRFRLPKKWMPSIRYPDLSQQASSIVGNKQPTAQQIFDWVCEIRQRKLPDPDVVPNVGSYFKSSIVFTPKQLAAISESYPDVVYYTLEDGNVKIPAAWLIDTCGWKGKAIGAVGVYHKHALVVINNGGATGADVLKLQHAIVDSVFQRFGVTLEREPVLI